MSALRDSVAVGRSKIKRRNGAKAFRLSCADRRGMQRTSGSHLLSCCHSDLVVALVDHAKWIRWRTSQSYSSGCHWYFAPGCKGLWTSSWSKYIIFWTSGRFAWATGVTITVLLLLLRCISNSIRGCTTRAGGQIAREVKFVALKDYFIRRVFQRICTNEENFACILVSTETQVCFVDCVSPFTFRYY